MSFYFGNNRDSESCDPKQMRKYIAQDKKKEKILHYIFYFYEDFYEDLRFFW